MSRWTRKGPWIQPAEIFDTPYPPNAQDDEFNVGSTLDASWTRFGTFDDVTAIDPYAAFAGVNGARWSHNVNRPSWYMIQVPATNTSIGMFKTVSLPTNCFVWVRGSFTYRNSTAPVNDGQYGFGLYTSSFNDAVIIELNAADTINQIQVTMGRINAGVFTLIKSTLTDGAVNAQGCQPIEAVGIQKLGTDYHGWALTAQGWLHLGSTTHASTFVYSPLYFYNTISTAPGNMICGVDFWRMKEGIYLP